jgi:glyoxylase-like metal-dependent hydrolase (beta-lactamase superfamily II)
MADVNIKTLVVGPLDVNCYIVWDEDTKDGVVVDPGGDGDVIAKEVKSLGVKTVSIIDTHGHFDHVGGNGELAELLNVKVAIHGADAHMIEGASAQSAFYGHQIEDLPPADVTFEGGSVIEAGSLLIKVLHTPGHTPGGVCLYIEAAEILITGDTLFAGSIGRSDLPGGDHETLLASIKEKILPLPDGVRVYPGHGGSSTVGEERTHNPFLQNI